MTILSPDLPIDLSAASHKEIKRILVGTGVT